MTQFHKYPHEVKFIKKHIEYEAYKLCKDFIEKNNTMLALSFGKDSMTILHILYKFNLLNNLKLVMFNHSGFEARVHDDFKNYVCEKYEINNFIETKIDNPEKYIKIDIENSLKNKGRMVEFAYNVLEKPRWKIMDTYNINGTIIGLRKEESKGRRINYYLRGKEYYNKRELSNILQPIINWNILDVFSYAYTEKIPIMPIYYNAKKYGFDFKKMRVNTIASLDATGNEINRIQLNKILYPEEFRDLINKIPQIRRLI